MGGGGGEGGGGCKETHSPSNSMASLATTLICRPSFTAGENLNPAGL